MRSAAGPTSRRSDGRRGARSAVAAGVALLSAAVVGAPLYVSAAGSESVQLQLADSCGADVALQLNVLPDPVTGVVDRQALREITDSIPKRLEPVLQETASVALGLPVDDDAKRRGLVVSRDGWWLEVGLDEIAPGAVVTQASTATRLQVSPGDELSLRAADTAPTGLPVRLDRTIADIPVMPEPSYWCGLRTALRPDGFTDPPPPMFLTDSSTMVYLAARAGIAVTRVWEVRAGDVRTLRDARRVRDGFVGALQRHDDELGLLLARSGDSPSVAGFRFAAGTEGMTAVVRRGEALAEAIGRAVAPVRLAGVLAAMSVLVAAGAMTARERRREMRLLALRGVPPHRVAWRVWVSVGPAGALGAVIGSGLAILAVRTLGPTAEMEPPVVARALIEGVGAVVVATIGVAATAALVGDRFVDRPRRRGGWRVVPWELPVVVLAVVAHRRLVDGGGLRFAGVEPRGGDLLAQAFPLLALTAVSVLLVRPLRSAADGMRRIGGRWPRALRLGWRRATAEPALFAALVAATAAAVGAVVLSGNLAASATNGLRDKAAVYVGSDLAVTMATGATVPADLAAHATVVARADAELRHGEASGADDEWGSRSIDLMGVDPTTFAGIARSVGSVDLADAVGSLLASGHGPVPALVVNGADVGEQESWDVVVRDTTVDVRVVELLDVFPGLRSGTTLVVVDAGALQRAGVGLTDVVWLRDPPDDAVQRLVDAGNLPSVVVSRDDVFDVVGFRAQRWTYDALAALGVLVGSVVVVMQLLVVESRTSRRRLAHVVLRRMGVSSTERWVTAVVECAVPLLLGGAAGAVTASVVSRIAIGPLDPLPTLAPTLGLVLPVRVLVTAAALLAGVVGVLAAVTVRSDTSGDEMEVMRGTA